MSETCFKISWPWTETFSLVFSEGLDKSWGNFLWFHVEFMSSPTHLASHLTSSPTLWQTLVEFNSFTIAKVPNAHTVCPAPCKDLRVKELALVLALGAPSAHFSLRFPGWAVGDGSPSVCLEAYVWWKGNRCGLSGALKGGKELAQSREGRNVSSGSASQSGQPPWVLGGETSDECFYLQFFILVSGRKWFKQQEHMMINKNQWI